MLPVIHNSESREPLFGPLVVTQEIGRQPAGKNTFLEFVFVEVALGLWWVGQNESAL